MNNLSTQPNLDGIAGRLRENVPLNKRSWFKTGGLATWLFIPKDEDDLINFLKKNYKNFPITILGACSNVIIRDGGIDGIIIKLMKGFNTITKKENSLIIGGGTLDKTVSHEAAKNNMKGLEFLSGIPGTIGAAVKMNAGAFGDNIGNHLEWADIILQNGDKKRLMRSDIKMTYRHADLPPGAIVTAVQLKTTKDDENNIQQRLREIEKTRIMSQPQKIATGGSTFKNPPHQKAWQLIDQANCRGLRFGGAKISTKHCNFMINTGNATSYDLEELGEIVRKKVLEKTGIMLEWEIKRIGNYKQKTIVTNL